VAAVAGEERETWALALAWMAATFPWTKPEDC
jgi:hypothetical protein